MEKFKSLRESGLLIKNVIKNEAKQQRNGEWINDMNYMNGDDAMYADNAAYFDNNTTFFENVFLENSTLKQSIVLNLISIKNLEILKHKIFSIKHYFILLFVIRVAVMMKKYLKGKN